MKKIIICLIIVLLIIPGPMTHAEINQPSREDLLYTLNNLLAQIASLQAILAERQSGTVIAGTPSITITEPTPYMTVRDGNSYTVSWDAKNIPPKSMLILDTKASLLYGGSGIGGGSRRKAIAPGNTKESWVLQTGVGHSDPGTYEVRVMVVECADILCTKSVVDLDPQTAAPIYRTKIHATSQWVKYSITEDKQIGYVGDGTITIGDIAPNEGKFKLGESIKISYYLFGNIKAGQQACFTLQSSTGKYFSPNSNTYQSCAPAKIGLNERIWTPFRTTGFQLNPGLYKINIEVPNLPNNSGKDAGTSAKKSSNWIELLPES